MAAKRLLIAASWFGVALFLAISFVSYDGRPEAGSVVSNLGGTVGQWIARQMIMAFGLGSFAISFFLVFVGYRILDRDAELTSPVMKCVGALLVMLTVATAVQAIDPHAGYAHSVYPLGGILGDTLASELGELFGGIGTAMILLLLFAASMIVATDTFFLRALLGVPARIREFLGGSRLRSMVRLRLPAAVTSAGAVTADEPKAPARKSRKKAKAAAVVEEEEDEYEEEFDDEEEYEDEEYEDEEEYDEEEDEYEEEEDEELEDEDEDEEEDKEEEAEEEVAAAPAPPRPEPVIKTGRVQTTGDSVEILKLERAKHLEDREMYALPPLTLIDDPVEGDNLEREIEIRRKARKLEDTLKTFGVDAQVVEISRGPTITIYELELASGTKVKKITSLPDDISMALKAKTIRIVAPIPGKSTVGIEVPNDHQEPVMLKELALSKELTKKRWDIPMLLGKDASGGALIQDLTKMPHMLIAGQTGSGKSVCLNSIIISILLTKYPEEVRMILIDPKMVELHAFRNIPHLLTPVVTDMQKAPKVLEWAVNEMERRYEILRAAGVRNIKSFNDLDEETTRERLAEHYADEELSEIPTHMPFVVLIVDELADLMMVSAKEVETSICRLAQKSRAVGLHVILATQRPSVDVITGLIKSNMPTRISFRVASKIDSRTILDQVGADRLLGRGDMLMIPPGGSSPLRCQAALVQDHEIKNLTKYIKDVAQPEYSRELQQVRATPSSGGSSGSNSDRDPLYNDAIRAVLQSGRGSVSMLQRKLEIGYTRAARLVDFMAEDGIVGDFKGSKAREVLKTLEQWEEELGENEQGA